ncbi:MAG: bifunctional riboflavin kinase/FAD synthetase [Acidimicrobiia bacterium]
MEIIDDLSLLPSPKEGSAITIGNFDGVHRGHRAVIEQVRSEARDRGFRSGVVTFDRHPAELLRPKKAPCRLSEPERKIELLLETGVDYLCVLRFDQELADMEPGDFVREILVAGFNVRLVVVGRNFRFGRNRRGSLALLEEMGARFGFYAEEMPLVSVEGFDISSTRIRAAVSHGDVEWAASALGREYSLRGIVLEGDKRGATLGFPTMNIFPPERMCLPADGVYAGWTVVDGSKYLAAINVGRRPTFVEEGTVLVESYLLDYEGGDAYGKTIEVGFSRWIRGEYRFANAQELVEQIARDVEEVRRSAGNA